jgi:hypothetical protein
MTEGLRSAMNILDETTRRQNIVKFIENRPGCTRADVDRGQSETGHVKTSRIIKELIKENVIVEERSGHNKRNKPLYVNKDHHLVHIPKEIDEFEKCFSHFLYKLIERNSPTIRMLNARLCLHFQRYKEELGKKGNDEKLSLDDIMKFAPDIDMHSDLEELSLITSQFVKALDIFFEFVRVYTTESILTWMLEINDKKVLSQLLLLVFNKISTMIALVSEWLTPILQTIFSKIGTLSQINEGPIDLQELPDFYNHFGMRAEVIPVLKQIAKIRDSATKSKFHLPLDNWGLSPSDVTMDTLDELYNPEAFYNRKLREDAEMEPGEFDGVDMMKLLRKDHKNKSRKK